MSLKDYIDLRFSQMRPKEYAALEKSGELEEELNRKVKYFEDQAKLLSENPDLQGWQIEEILFHDLFPKSEEQEEEEAQDALEPDPLDEWHQSKMSNYDENGIPLGKRQQ
ncbi:MAG: hypothetical protein HY313_04635, partial [Acidobacteria bacterium]|nr:hypothetical protein [Acidobacteriota bacterium]